MTYNEVASLQDDDIKKIFYAFTWDNNDKYYDLITMFKGLNIFSF